MAGSGAKSLIAVQLQRDGFKKPWGFRLQGGIDQGQLLTVQRVFMQSPSEGILHRGDTVIRINDYDATRVPLHDAEELINNTALTLRLEVQRTNAGSSTPTSPVPQSSPYGTGPPQFQRQTSETYKQHAQFQQEQIQKYQQAQPAPAWQNSPTLQMIQQGNQPNRNAPRWEREGKPVQPYNADESNAPSGQNMKRLVEVERSKKSGVLDYAVPLPNLDKLSVTNQTYRTNQLISPGPKAKHYRPTGSYLDASFGRGQTQVHQSTPLIPVSPSTFNKPGRPKSMYETTGNLSPSINGFQRQNSLSPAPQKIMGGSREWPPKSPVPYDSPPASAGARSPANPFNFSGQSNNNAANYGYPQQQYQNYQQQQQQYQQQQQRPQYQQQQSTGQLPFQIPQTGQAGRQIVHSQFNSPAGLYSTQNAVDMFTGQTGLRPNQVTGKGKPLTNYEDSPTYKLLQASQGQRGGVAWGHAPAPRQSKALNALDPYITEL